MTSMTAFVKVVDVGGFAAAARKLDMSPSMVTTHVRALEERLGVRLLNRSTRRTSLTEVGQAYYERCLAILGSGDLESKLAPPFGPNGELLPDTDPGQALHVPRPERSAELEMRGGAARLPRPNELDSPRARATCLRRFAHHELMAVELFAWALLRWPELAPELRRELALAMADEQRHCRTTGQQQAEGEDPSGARENRHGGHHDGDL